MQGETREEALEMLDEAVALHKGEAGDSVPDDDLREWGVDPDTVPDEAGGPDAPWFDADEERRGGSFPARTSPASSSPTDSTL